MIFILKAIKKIPKKFLIVGVVNTIFGYVTGLINYFLLNDYIGIIAVGILNNIASITFSFLMFKKFVFKTKNTNWFYEYLRSYIVYGVKGIVSILTLWFCVKVLKIDIYISQGIAIFITIFLSYKGHKDFTFKVKNVE